MAGNRLSKHRGVLVMDIVRAGFGDTDIFTQEQLNCGACCFYTESREYRYFFDINGREAILYADSQQYIDKVIDEFLFYSGFISCVKDADGRMLRKTNEHKMKLLEITQIQPSQFYINERKLASCKPWIKSQTDVMIPLAAINGKTVSLDGHTRMRAALDLGYESVYVYDDDYDEYITYFVNEAVRRNILSVSDMEIVDDNEYKLKWHKFCDDFFENMK